MKGVFFKFALNGTNKLMLYLLAPNTVKPLKQRNHAGGF